MNHRPPLVLALGFIPLIGLVAYLAHVYPQLPAQIATTFDGAGAPIAYSSKQSWLALTLGLTAFINAACTAPMFLGLHRKKPGSPAYHQRLERFMAIVIGVMNSLQVLWAHVVACRSLPKPFYPLDVYLSLALTFGSVIGLLVMALVYLRKRT